MGPEDPPPLSAANRATLQKGISIKAGHHTHSQTQALQGLSQSDGLVPLWGGGQDGEEVISLAVLDWIQTAWWQPQELVNLRSTWRAGLEKSNHYPNLRMIK
jgi:hypothetical protein